MSRLRFSSDTFAVAGLIAILVALGAVVGWLKNSQPVDQRRPPYSSYDSGARGTLALKMWFEAIGYTTERIEGESFTLPARARVLFVLNPTFFTRSSEAQAVQGWVERGNTLVLVDLGGTAELFPLKSALKLASGGSLAKRAYEAALEQPVTGAIPARPVAVETNRSLVLERADYVQYLSAEGKPLLVSFRQKQGTVWLTSAPHLFTNEALQNEANAALVGAMLGRAPRGSLIAFDEFHPYVSARPTSAQALLFGTPIGWAFLYGLVVVLLFLAINGQRLGRTIPLPENITRRRPAEFVLAMAQLFRRAGKRQLVLRHYATHLKRKLGKPYDVNPDLPDEEFVTALARANDKIDREALARTLRGLSPKQIRENEMVKWVNQAAKLIERRG